MPLQKQSLNINFANGLDTKSDPWQISPGKMLELKNVVFTKQGLLQKRNGFGQETTLPDTSSTTLATFNDSLLAIGTQFQALSPETNQWYQRGPVQPLRLSVTPCVRTTSSQETVDVAVASNGLACAVYLDSSTDSFYQIVNTVTGQIIVDVTALPATAAMPRVFSLGNFFVVTFLATVTTDTHLQYIAIPIGFPDQPGTATSVSTQASGLGAAYDGYVANDNLYLAVNGSDLGGAIRITYLDSTLNQHGTEVIAGDTADLMSVTADISGSTANVYVTYWDTTSNDGFTAIYDQNLVEVLPSTQVINNIEIVELTSVANAAVGTVFYEVNNEYTFDTIRSDYIEKVTINTAGTVGTPAVVARSVGLASKAFYFSTNDMTYMLAVYAGSLQPTFFLIDDSGSVIAKLSYQTASGYAINQILPGVTITDNLIQIGYLYKEELVPVNKSQGANPVEGVYSQNGINLVNIEINNSAIIKAEIASNLHLSGGFLWMYDGVKPVEHGFHLYPEDIGTADDTTGGSLEAQQYYYYVTYEWTDAQGNLHRSAPSVPVSVDLSGSGTSTNKVTLSIPTLRLTYKTDPNGVRIVIYRWSLAQQIPYQVTSIASPLLNDPSVDSVEYEDTLADSAILGNVILYTTGGVVENIAAPALSSITLFKSRLVGINSEDPNTLWYSKSVIQGVPVEMSDLFTLFVAPTVSAQGSTGPSKCIAPLDDKLIVFKKDAAYYFTGNGPDITGANNDFSEPIFITSTVGCSNQDSIVFIPQGLMFQSDKGIWLLGRDLSTTYIGSPVEEFNDATVLSAINVPGTNQVRFTLDNGVTLMYDYFYNQWGTFTNIPAISSVLYQNLHTYLNEFGQVFQENVGSYIDGSKPVLFSFKTGWFNLAGLQGYERAYFFYLLGKYYTPHKLSIGIAYDYNPSAEQNALILPDNFSGVYGSDPLYGDQSLYGGPSQVEQWRVFFEKQRCQAFQLTVNELFDSTLGVIPGLGVTLSGLNLVVGAKRLYTTISAANSVGSSSATSN